MELTDAHKAQVAKFISYFKGKRERLISDRESEKNEFKSDRLSDDGAIFNKMDVEDLLDTYHAQIVGCVREALEEFINLSAVFLSQVLVQAQQSDLTLDGADLSAIEDHNRVDQIATLVMQGMAPQAPVAAKRTSLPTLAASPQPVGPSNDPALLQKVAELEVSNQQFRERYQLMQSQVAELLKERSTLTSELEKIGGEAAAAAAAATAARGAAAAAAAAAPAVPERIGDSSQFKELKAIVKKKSDEVKELRKRLVAAGLPLPGDDGGVDLAPDDD